jgi:hypothetical protein
MYFIFKYFDQCIGNCFSVFSLYFSSLSQSLSPILIQQSVLVESPVSLGVISLDPSLSDSPIPSSAPSFSTPPTLVRRGGAVGGGKKGKRRKDPNEPQKPVSAYALFFRDTQAAIKGQNPNATFGEVSKIVASMWESLGDEQKQVNINVQTNTLMQTFKRTCSHSLYKNICRYE